MGKTRRVYFCDHCFQRWESVKTKAKKCPQCKSNNILLLYPLSKKYPKHKRSLEILGYTWLARGVLYRLEIAPDMPVMLLKFCWEKEVEGHLWSAYITNECENIEIFADGNTYLVEYAGGWKPYAVAVNPYGVPTGEICDDFNQPIKIYKGDERRLIYDIAAWARKGHMENFRKEIGWKYKEEKKPAGKTKKYPILKAVK